MICELIAIRIIYLNNDMLPRGAFAVPVITMHVICAIRVCELWS